ncbi:hypothetical protein CANCADRAFT_1492 [Tortispora caseinolytica NRRL Y-17796]|uniref:Uncharacterized protein n=1 Tax=Tortispora caseinolytica NRRL Y-17796 TaxID=767744 RepID=A0A1E4TMD4_9ASCO|nr:hypothetical protein CANCADRAFT_1492 [Tortispora caseinolytica NRRL Y-17796]
MQQPLSRVFWPKNIPPSNTPRLLIGWKTNHNDYLIVSALHIDRAPALMPLLLSEDNPAHLTSAKKSLHELYAACGNSKLSVLGLLDVSAQQDILRLNLPSKKQLLRVSLPTRSRPLFHSHAPEAALHFVYHVFLYSRPNPRRLQFFSIDPIQLELPGRQSVPVMYHDYEKSIIDHRARQALLNSLILPHAPARALSVQETSLDVFVLQINCAHEVDQVLTSATASPAHSSILSRPEFTFFFSTLWSYFILVLTFLFKLIFIPSFLLLRCSFEILFAILEYRISSSYSSLKEISATAMQLDLRLQQLCYLPSQYVAISTKNKSWRSLQDFQPDYIRFYNTLWLITNDVIIGTGFGALVLNNKEAIVAWITVTVNSLLIKLPRNLIVWLMDAPAGIKLNIQLAEFFGELCLWINDANAQFLKFLIGYAPLIVTIVGYSGYLGLTFSLSLISDLVSLFTLHIYSYFVSSARFYHMHTNTLISLFHLFRGKRRNVLRNRIDSCDYDLDQQLAGTLLFIVLGFLWLTVFVFYAAFAISRIIIISVNALLELSLAFCNHFPLFALMLRVKDSKRLPGGLKFKILPTDASKVETGYDTVIYISMESKPLEVSSMFRQYIALWEIMKVYYMSFQVIKLFSFGKYVPMRRNRLYSLLYSTLPEKPVSIPELLKLLKITQ